MAKFERLATKYGNQYISIDKLFRLLDLAYTCGKADSDINQLAWAVLYQELEDFEKTFKFTGSGVPEHLQSVKFSIQPFENERQKRKYIRNMKNHREVSAN